MGKYRGRTSGFAAFALLTLICVILFGSYMESGKVFAADITGTTEGGLEYKIEHGEASITGYQGESKQVVIPSTITVGDTNYPVTVIGSDAFNSKNSINNIESVEIPNTVTSIGSSAFSGSGIKSITIPDSVTYVGDGIFQYCNYLEEANLLNEIEELPSRMFIGCNNLKNVYLPTGLTSIGSSSFSGCSSLSSVIIPSGVTYIGNGAFRGCTSIQSVNIPAGITTIENSTFYGCENLSTLVLPEGIETIGVEAFSGCTKLTAITIPETVKYIYDYAFYNCSSAKEITLNESLETIGRQAFYGCDFNQITIPKTVRNIGEEAMGFWLNAAGQSKVIDGFTITGYKNSAASIYAENNNIAFVSLGTLETISGISFTPSDSNTAVNLDIANPKLDLTIDNYEDDDETYCGTLKVTSLGSYCNGTSSNNSIVGISYWGNNQFELYARREGTANITISVKATAQYEAQTVVIPVTVVKDTNGKPVTGIKLYEDNVTVIKGGSFWLDYDIIPRKATNWNVTWTSSNESVAIVDGDDGDYEVIGLSVGTAVITVTTEDGGFTDTCTVNVVDVLPNQPTSGAIGPNAYWKYDSGTMTVYGSGSCEEDEDEGQYEEYSNYRNVTTSLIIEEGITGISRKFDKFTAIESVEFPKSLNRIDESFINCSNLKSISFAPGSEITLIGGAFNNCSQLSSVTFPEGTKLSCVSDSFKGSAIENLTIPSIKEIYLDDNDNIKAVTINGGMIKPTADMFSGCSSLSNLKIAGFTVKDGIVYNSSTTALVCNAFGNGEVTVPDSVVAIQRDAFNAATRITKLTIPASVARIDDEAFSNEIITTSPQFKIAGYENTEAQYYALGKNIPFVSLGQSPLSDNEEIAALQKQLAQLTAEVAALKDSIGGASGSAGAASAQMIANLENQIKELKTKVDSLEKVTSADKIASIQSEIDSLKNTVDNLKKDSSEERISSLEKLLLKLSKVKGMKLSSKAKKTIKVKWKALDYIKLDGYQVYYSTKKTSGFKLAGKTSGKTSFTIKKGIKSGKKYYIKVRGFKKYDGKKIYTRFSKPIRVKAK